MIERIRIGRGAKMLCPMCGEVSEARQEGDSDTVYLCCGHERTAYLPPAKDGAVGLEGLIWNQPEALRLFPPVHSSISEIDERYVSENYWR